eukprot:COSAG06_NODE_7526_length_2471_cov_4.635329_2_plen_272_part_00
MGGMLAGGMVDDSNAGNTRAYDGIAAELYRRVARHYRASDPATACFKGEPGVVEGVMREWLTQENITLRLGEAIEHLQLKSGGLIASATLTSGLRVTAPQWIDASYEGDLLALAEVPVLFGRESSARWNESLAGQGLCSNAVRNDAVFTPTYETFTVPENATDAAGRLLAGVDGEYSTWDEAAGLLRSDTRVCRATTSARASGSCHPLLAARFQSSSQLATTWVTTNSSRGTSQRSGFITRTRPSRWARNSSVATLTPVENSTRTMATRSG